MHVPQIRFVKLVFDALQTRVFVSVLKPFVVGKKTQCSRKQRFVRSVPESGFGKAAVQTERNLVKRLVANVVGDFRKTCRACRVARRRTYHNGTDYVENTYIHPLSSFENQAVFDGIITKADL